MASVFNLCVYNVFLCIFSPAYDLFECIHSMVVWLTCVGLYIFLSSLLVLFGGTVVLGVSSCIVFVSSIGSFVILHIF